MNAITVILLLFLGAAFFFVMWGIGIYNSLVTLRNIVKTAFAQIDVQLQRRYDLIPNLVEVAKKYMQHERETLEAVINARNSAVDASRAAAEHPVDGTSVKNLLNAEQALGGALGKLFALREAYPDLKADKQMSQLMSDLTETEDKIAYSRQAYNSAVMNYNTKTELFPSSVIAGLFKFQQADLYQVDSDEIRKAPKVEF